MFNTRIFRTTKELDFLRGPLLAAYLRFEILLWLAIAVLGLLALLGELFLPAPRTISTAPDLAVLLAFSTLALVVLVAVWRFKKWGVVALLLWTLILAGGALASLFSPPVDWFAVLALLGFVTARTFILLFEIRPKWAYFTGGIM